MSIILAEVLDILELDISRVKSAKNALNKQVERVNILEAPDAVKWLGGKEFVLTTGYAIQKNDDFHVKFLQELSDKGIAGLGIKAGRYLDPIPSTMIKEGERLGFPIIELPAELPLSQVVTPIYEKLLNQQVRRLKQSQAVHAKFLEVVLRGEGFQSISATLTALINKASLIVDSDKTILAFSDQGNPPSIKAGDWQELLSKVEPKCYDQIISKTSVFLSGEGQVQAEAGEFALFPICGGNHFWGAILVKCPKNDQDLQWVTAGEHAATVAALEFTKQDSIFRANLTSESQLLEDILDGNFASLQSVERRLEHFGFKFQERLKTFVLDIIDFEAYYMQEARKSEKHFRQVKDEIYRLTKGMFHDFPGSLLGGIKSDSVIAIVSMKDDEAENRFKRVVPALSDALKKEFPRIRISCGISRSYKNLGEVPRSFEEAFIACKVGRNLNGDSLVAYYADLGPYVCLNEMRDWSIARQLYDETIGLLETYDMNQGTELVYTLQNYFLNNDNVRQTAKKLFMHRNSLEYRLKRIEELTGKKLGNLHDRFELMFSLALGKLIKTDQANRKV